MKFINRQQEIEELKGYFDYEPSSILVVHGPKSSGKTTLLNHVVENYLKDKKYAINIINLRGALIYDFKSFLEVFFQKTTGDKVRGVLSGLTLNAGFFQVGLDDEAMLKKNPFKVMEDQLQKAKKKGLHPIIILDEIQSLKAIYMNGERALLDELFNFFVRLTKEIHIAHVVLASSDSFFISEIYDSASLLKTADFLLVNQLEEIAVLNWLKQEQFSAVEISFVWEHTKGNAWEIEQIIRKRKQGKTVQQSFEKILEFNIAKLDHYFIHHLKESKEKEAFNVIARKIIEEGRYSTVDFYNSMNERGLKDMIDRDLWFYNGMKREITANSESVRRAMKVILS